MIGYLQITWPNIARNTLKWICMLHSISSEERPTKIIWMLSAIILIHLMNKMVDSIKYHRLWTNRSFIWTGTTHPIYGVIFKTPLKMSTRKRKYATTSRFWSCLSNTLTLIHPCIIPKTQCVRKWCTNA